MSILTPEAHRDPYIWGAVLLAHVAIGCMGWPYIGWWIVPAYLVIWEGGAALLSRSRLYADSILDWDAVALGACVAAGLHPKAAVGAVLAILAVGYLTRWR